MGRQFRRGALLAVGLIAWAATVSEARILNLPAYCTPAGAPLAIGWQGLEGAIRLNGAGPLASSWAIMLAAMMSPLLAAPLDHVWERSLPRRRLRAVALFLLGYALIWLPFGILELALVAAAHAFAGTWGMSSLLPIAAFAFVWQISPWKQHCLNNCHKVAPLRASGVRAGRDVMRFGLGHGAWCVGACAPLMAIPLLSPGAHAPLMALVALFLLGERMERPGPADWRLRWPRSAALAGLAALRRAAAPGGWSLRGKEQSR